MVAWGIAMDLSDFLVLIGLSTFAYGVSMINLPAAFVVVGLFLIAVGVWRIFS